MVGAGRPDDGRWMRAALSLARRGLGNTAPNPTVGCILVKHGKVIGRGWTQPGGRPHAEQMALQMAGKLASGATAYVTLEPCAHVGQTPSCASALIEAGIRRVVVALSDPDPRVSGKGNKRLKDAGIILAEGILHMEAARLNNGFLKSITEGLPHVSLKLATSLDGKIALASGLSQWITGPVARMHGHMLRAQHDAILTGVGTVLADDPMLNCRLPGRESDSPVRIILDRHQKLSEDSRIARTAHEIPTLLISEHQAPLSWTAHKGIEEAYLPDLGDVTGVLKLLAEKGMSRILVEAGASVSSSFIRAQTVDTLYHYQAPKVLGGDSLDMIGPLELAKLNDALHFTAVSSRKLGRDTLTIFRRSH